MTEITATALICALIAQLSVREVFCSQDLLAFVKREQLDNILCRLVKRKVIVRLSSGVFCRNVPEDPALPSLAEIEIAKARVFQRRLGEHAEQVAARKNARKNESRNPEQEAKTIYTTSATSSMNTIYGRVYYRRTSARWLKPAN